MYFRGNRAVGLGWPHHRRGKEYLITMEMDGADGSLDAVPLQDNAPDAESLAASAAQGD